MELYSAKILTKSTNKKLSNNHMLPYILLGLEAKWKKKKNKIGK